MEDYVIEWVDVKDLKPYEKNAKKHDKKQVEQIANSIREFGFKQNLVIDEDNVVIIGHGRLEAAKSLSMDMVPCVRAKDLTEEQIKALRLADNKLNESEWDFDLMAAELEGITELDMSAFGFDIFEPETAETIEEESAFDDIEKLEKHYGVPYQGNKSRIADIIISLLPAGKRLVDLFGGVEQLRIAQCFRANGSVICITI